MNIFLRETLNLISDQFDGINSALETGSHEGWGSLELIKFFPNVYTVELGAELCAICRESFKGKNIEIFEGKGPDGIHYFLPKIEGEYLAFIDSHFSQCNTVYDPEIGPTGTPTLQELEGLKSKPPKIIIVDDWADFERIEGYPSHESVLAKIKEIGNYYVWVRNEKNHQLICIRQ